MTWQMRTTLRCASLTASRNWCIPRKRHCTAPIIGVSTKPACLTTPPSGNFPYADVSGSGDSADNDALVEYYVDLDGDGVEERLAFCYAGDKALWGMRPSRCASFGLRREHPSVRNGYLLAIFQLFLPRRIDPGRKSAEDFSGIGFVCGRCASKIVYLAGVCAGRMDEQATVHDPGYSDCVLPWPYFEPGGMETDLYYNDMAYSPSDCGQEYLSALANVFGNYGIGFELAEREIYEPYEGAYYAGGTYFRAIFRERVCGSGRMCRRARRNRRIPLRRKLRRGEKRRPNDSGRIPPRNLRIPQGR